MRIIVCLDLNDGFSFNNRRQSRDSKVYENISRYIKGNALRVNEYSAELFKNINENVIVSDEFISKAKSTDYCFVENIDITDLYVEELVVYRWDKIYPADKKLEFDYSSMTLNSRLEFAGKSHDKIIREVYVR